VNAVVAQILADFAIETSPRQIWGGYLGDLRRILWADYEEPVARYVAAGELPVAALVHYASSRLFGFNEVPLAFGETLAYARDRRRGLGLNVRMSPFGKPGHPLRGFYHPLKEARPLIWLNRQHTETAVGATFAHELGHHFWGQMAGDDGDEAHILQHFGFVEHLADPRELFADVFAALSGYPLPAARRLFGGRKWYASQLGSAVGATAAVARVEKHVHRHYPGNLGPDSGLSRARRLYYLGGLVHFSKLRAAVLRVTGT